jgi:hypothetical protein
MTTKEYEGYSMRRMANGQIKKYPTKKKYTVSNAYVIPDDVRAEIIRKHKEGVSAARIARDVGLTAGRVSRVIKKQATGAAG